ncbi:Coagulation factor V [Stylophora pistillata]|uniref:Coagulation factor V n=1 Tax=Stylophora pistillata TaxID=50429 RepID=A0A2B4SHE1_STYPI|nr:Coagulation factor V [Stylophora pistillata]
MRTEVFGVEKMSTCNNKPIGLAIGGEIPDSSFVASSEHNYKYVAEHGRLNNYKSWGPMDNNNADDFLQIDLLYEYIICAVATQGNPKIVAPEWTTYYKIRLSFNDTTFDTYKENNTDKRREPRKEILVGNNDRNSEVKHVVYRVLTRYLRFLPKTHQRGVCMRTEVFGVEKMSTCDMKAIGLADGGKIPNSSFTATSIYDDRYRAECGRLNKNKAWAPKDNNNIDDFLQIDLLYEYIVCAVATQGNPSSRVAEWTTHYRIHLSLNDTTFDTYNESNNDKVFPGNKNRDITVKNSLNNFASAKYIRFVPTQYHSWKTLRVEVYGILLTKVPPRIIEELSPSSVMCKKQTPCLLSCQATSYIPLNFSWTKDGQVPTGDNMKLLNNSIIVTPRDGRDYGDYVCHAANSFGSTAYKITLLAPTDNQVDDDTQSIFFAGVIALSCIVVVLLIIICGLIWQYRRAVHKRIQRKQRVDFDGVKSSPDQQSSDEHASDPNTYMELKPRPSIQESQVLTEYQSLQEKPEKQGYYNMVLQKENGGKRNEEVYEEI